MSAADLFFDTHLNHFVPSYEPGCILVKCDRLKDRQLQAFNALPQPFKACNACRGTINRAAGLCWWSDTPHGFHQQIYDGTHIPSELLNIIAQYVTPGQALTPILRVSRSVEVEDTVDVPTEMKHLMSTFQVDSKSIHDMGTTPANPDHVQWKLYGGDPQFRHIMCTQQMCDALDVTKGLWRLAGVVHPQAVKLFNVFDGNAASDLPLLRVALSVHQSKVPQILAKTLMALDFLPELMEASANRWTVVRLLSRMGFQVTESTFAASSSLYTLASIMVGIAQDKDEKQSQKSDAKPLFALIKQIQTTYKLSFAHARRVSMTVWSVWMRNRKEAAYPNWVCPSCKTPNCTTTQARNNQDSFAPPSHSLCVQCGDSRPQNDGWSCRNSECKYRNYDVKTHGITALCCFACGTQRGMALGAWACPVCTFHNKNHCRNCSMCMSPKPS